MTFSVQGGVTHMKAETHNGKKEKDAYITLEDFDELYRKFGPMVLRRCRYLLGSEEEALDIMQDVFVRIIERRERLSAVCSSLFYTVATNLCLNRLRSDKRRYTGRSEFLMDEFADTGKHHEDITDTGILLETIFAEEKEDTRCMAILHYIDGLTLEETAEATGLSVSGVRKRLATLRKRAISCAGV